MIERRFVRPSAKPRIETRADGSKLIVGYGAVFYRAGDVGTEYELWPGLVERIGPTAFNRALAERQDVRGLYNHNPSHILGRTASGTMRLSVDDVGLRYELDFADTQLYRDLAISLERGDIDGSSFGFVARTRRYESLDDRNEIMWIDDADLFDVGPVTYPAYTATSAEIRSVSAELVKPSYAAWRAQHAGPCGETDAVAMRLALLRLDDSN